MLTLVAGIKKVPPFIWITVEKGVQLFLCPGKPQRPGLGLDVIRRQLKDTATDTPNQNEN